MMPSVGVMAMTLTDIACELVVWCLTYFLFRWYWKLFIRPIAVYFDLCRLNLHMVDEDHHHMIAIVVTVAGAVVDFLGALTIAVGLVLIVLSRFLPPWKLSYLIWLCLHATCNISVLVSGLPSSASWQDLKVRIYNSYYVMISKTFMNLLELRINVVSFTWSC